MHRVVGNTTHDLMKQGPGLLCDAFFNNLKDFGMILQSIDVAQLSAQHGYCWKIFINLCPPRLRIEINTVQKVNQQMHDKLLSSIHGHPNSNEMMLLWPPLSFLLSCYIHVRSFFFHSPF